MKNSLYLASLLLLSFGTWAAQNAPVPSFSITIKATQSTVKTGSAVRIEMVFKNVSSHEIGLAKSPASDQGESVNSLEIRDGQNNLAPETEYNQALEGKRDTYEGHVSIPGGSRLTLPLKPGETMADAIIASKLYDLSKPGNYTIQAQRWDRENKTLVKSNTITVTVTP